MSPFRRLTTVFKRVTRLLTDLSAIYRTNFSDLSIRMLNISIHRRKLVKISGGARGARVIGGGMGQCLGGTMASAEQEPITGVWWQSPQRGPGTEPLVRGQGGEAPLNLKGFWSLDVQRSLQI